MELNKQKAKKIALITAASLAGLLILITIAFFIFRQRLLKYVVDKVITRVEATYPVKLTIGRAAFDDFNTVGMSNIALVPIGKDTLLTTDSVHATVSVRSLIRGRVLFKHLEIANAYLTAIKKDSLNNNYSFLIKKKKEEPKDTLKTGRNLGKTLNTLIETAFENVPDKVSFRNLNVSYNSPSREVNMAMPYLTVDDGTINTSLTIQTDSLVNRLVAKGNINPGKYRISGSLFAQDTAGITLPYTKEKFGGTVGFDTLHFSLTDKAFRRDILTIRGEASVTNAELNHYRVAHKPVVVHRGQVNYKLSVGPNYYSVDSLTKVTFNKIVFYPQISLVTEPVKKVVMKVRSEETPANDFFESLPSGMFETLEGIKAEGSLSYKMKLLLDMSNVDKVVFDSDLDASPDFKILEYEETNLEKINKSFEYTAYEYGKPVRTFTVGPQNPYFTPLNQISPHLRNAILTAEDAGFFRHKGFHEEAFRQSIATNIKKRKFVRGGSTISMQLVKNVFLTRQKTIARKVEEALIVWLIENQKLSTKHRMYEVYLNIIEWGPNVYGAKDASRFFFGKNPDELNLAESIYLASIIPKPKAYKSSFDQYGNLKGYVAGYFRLISGIMVRRGLISQEDYEALEPRVQLYGRARDLIITAKDTANMDLDFIPPADMLD